MTNNKKNVAEKAGKGIAYFFVTLFVFSGIVVISVITCVARTGETTSKKLLCRKGVKDIYVDFTKLNVNAIFAKNTNRNSITSLSLNDNNDFYLCSDISFKNRGGGGSCIADYSAGRPVVGTWKLSNKLYKVNKNGLSSVGGTGLYYIAFEQDDKFIFITTFDYKYYDHNFQVFKEKLGDDVKNIKTIKHQKQGKEIPPFLSLIDRELALKVYACKDKEEVARIQKFLERI